MSQAKVERNKDLKKNRKSIVKKAKRNRIIAMIISIVVLAALVGWIGYSIYYKVTTNNGAEQTYLSLDITGLMNYFSE